MRKPAFAGALAVGALGLNALVWGVSWWPLRLLEQWGVSAVWATALVYALAAAAVLAWQPRAWSQMLANPGLWVLAMASGATNAAFNLGVTQGDVVRVVLLFYLMPIWAALLARALLGERPGASGWLRLGLALGGAMIVLWPRDGGWPWPRTLPDWLGVAGGFFFALNNVLLRKYADRPAAARALAMFAGGPLVAGSLAALLLVFHLGPGLPPPAAGWVLGVAVLSLAFLAANLGLQFGTARLTAAMAAVAMTTEVVFATVSSILGGVATLQRQTVFGGSLIVLAALLAGVQFPRRRGPGRFHDDSA